MMAEHVLVKYRDNWADEMDIEGFRLMTIAEWEDVKQRAAAYFKENTEYTYYIGTNEEVTFRGYNAWERHFDVFNLLDHEYHGIKRTLGDEFGFFPFHDFEDEVWDVEEDEDEE